MRDFLTDLSPEALIMAVENNVKEIFGLMRLVPSVELHEEPHLHWSISNLAHPIFNSVMRATLAPDQVESVIDSLLTRYRSRYVPVLWRVGPSSSPPDLASRLEARGFIDVGTLMGFALDLHTLDSSPSLTQGFTVERVLDPTRLRDWRLVLLATNELPRAVADEYVFRIGIASVRLGLPYFHYVGYLNGVPVATSSLFLGGGVAGLYNVATIPSHRGRGFATAVTLAALEDARARGYRVAVLESEDNADRIYRRLGFEEQCRTKGYAWIP